MKKNNKEVVERTTKGFVEKREELMERVAAIDPEKTEKSYVADVWLAIKELKIAKSMNDMSALLGKSGNYFYAIMHKPEGTQRRIGLSFTPASKLHIKTNGAFDIDRMLPWLAERLSLLSYFKLEEGKITEETEAVLSKLGYKKRKVKAKTLDQAA